MEEIIKDWKDNAESNENENFYFLTALKLKNAHKVDRLAKELHQETFSKIDCTKCANCCKTTTTGVNQKDVERISSHLNLTEDEFKTKYLTKDESGDMLINQTPCPFLGEDDKCTIYEVRPQSCEEYPHTDKKEFAKRRFMHSDNTLTCPAVYHIVERMKRIIK
jgi:uncharacterized protein